MHWWKPLAPPKGKCRSKKASPKSGNDAKRRCEQSPVRPRTTTNSSNAAQAHPQMSPQPLPLPQLQLLLGLDDKPSNPGNVPKPSLQDLLVYQLDKDANGVNGLGKLATRDGIWSTEYHETRSARRSSQPQSMAEKSLENNGLYGHRSAPATPYAIPNRNYPDIFTPQHMTPPVWKSTPEASPSETTPGPGSSNHSPSGTTSQLPKRVPSESSLLKGESTPRSGVHSLPRPPGGMTLQHPPVPPPPLTPEILPVNSRWQKGKLIGRGTFGSVYVASNRHTGALCAMKEVEISYDDNKSTECLRQLEQEIKVLSNLKHPNIVQYYGSEIVGDRFYIYLEYVHPGSITKFIKDHGAMTERVVRSFTRHILCGLAYLHSTKTIHRDIKGANLLVDAFGVVKLADFGMAKHLNGHNSNLSLKGSPYWMPPELLQSVMQQGATADVALAVDIWSLGCTIIEMLTGSPPWIEYEGPAAMFRVLHENPPIPDDLSDEGRDFLNCCFKRNPAERPSASMLLEHQFVKDSHQLDVPSTSLLELTETIQSQKENPINKIDRVPSDDIKGKQFDNESGQQCHQDAFNPKAVYHHSPRSTLDPLPGLSPPHSRH